MKKKVFALASVTALTGAVVIASTAAGCSSSGTVPENEAGTSSGTIPDSGRDVKEGGSSSGDPDTGPTTCPTLEVIDATTFPWKPPSKTPGACTEAEL
ncbi:MAG: hypothetical protein JST00_30175, partial [Deltaproteobacteria bacterium]|nr:hypothetical protein [Deltaproteobacteria bacterium]